MTVYHFVFINNNLYINIYIYVFAYYDSLSEKYLLYFILLLFNIDKLYTYMNADENQIKSK